MSQEKRRMRPMGITDILDETVELYKSSFVLLVGIAAVMQVPYAVFMQTYTVAMMHVAAGSTGTQGPSPSDIFGMLGGIIVSGAWLLIAAPFVTGALTYAISERYLSRKATIFGSFKQVFNWSVFWQLAGAILIKAAAMIIPIGVVGAAIGLAVIANMGRGAAAAAMIPAFIVLGLAGIAAGFVVLYLMLRLAVVEPSIIVERKGLGHALSRSWKLMPGSLLKCFALLLIASLVTGIVEAIVSQPTQALMLASAAKGGSPSYLVIALHTVITALVGTILAPITSIVTILLYYDIRVRREGFDLELLASELGAKTREMGAWNAQTLPQEQASVEQVTEQAPPGDEAGSP